MSRLLVHRGATGHKTSGSFFLRNEEMNRINRTSIYILDILDISRYTIYIYMRIV